MGWRGRRGGRTGFWPGRGPYGYLPPWQRRGSYGYGRGVGYGYGRGLGYGYWGDSYNPWLCQRFPWLPRWWWAQPAAQGYRAPYTGYGYPRRPYPSYTTPYTVY